MAYRPVEQYIAGQCNDSDTDDSFRSGVQPPYHSGKASYAKPLMMDRCRECAQKRSDVRQSQMVRNLGLLRAGGSPEAPRFYPLPNIDSLSRQQRWAVSSLCLQMAIGNEVGIEQMLFIVG